MSNYQTIALESDGMADSPHSEARLYPSQWQLSLADVGKTVVRIALAPVIFGLACSALLVFGVIAKHSDRHSG